MHNPAPRVAWLAVFLLTAGMSPAKAPEALKPEQADQARQWVRQLSDRSYRVREAAYHKLGDLGAAAASVLEEGLKADDFETRRRCERLLELARRTETEIALTLFISKKDDSKLLKLPSYERFKKLVGNDEATKKLYVDMYCVEGTMLAEQDRNPREFAARFLAYCQEIQRNLYTPWGQANPIPHHRVVALLFMATDSHVSKDIQNFYMLNNLFYQPTVQQGFRDSAGSRKLLMAYLEQRATTQNSQQIFYVAKNLGLKEAVPLAQKVIADKTVNQYTRGMAVLFIGQMGGKDHIKELENLLADTTNLGSVRFNNATVTAQMRDVALASLIMASGQNLADYSFPYLQQFRGIRGDMNLPPYYYGFSDDTSRQAALKRWKDTQAAAQPKK